MPKALFDSMLTPRLAADLPSSVQVISARRQRWRGKSNGELLRLAAESGFDAVITLDKDMPYQQNELKLPLPVIILHPKGQALEDIRELMPEVAGLLGQALEKRFHHLGPGFDRELHRARVRARRK